MKKYFFLLFAIALNSCALNRLGTKYHYSYRLISPDTSMLLSHEDDKMKIDFSLSDKDVNFTLKNKSNSTMRIMWDDASLVQFGKAMKVMHNGIKFTERNNSQAPTSIPSQASLDDVVLPTENVYYREPFYSTYYSDPGGWEQHDLFPTHDMNEAETKSAILKSPGQELTLYLPIQHEGKTIDYTFKFQVDKVVALKLK